MLPLKEPELFPASPLHLVHRPGGLYCAGGPVGEEQLSMIGQQLAAEARTWAGAGCVLPELLEAQVGRQDRLGLRIW